MAETRKMALSAAMSLVMPLHRGRQLVRPARCRWQHIVGIGLPDITGEKAIEVALQHRPGVHIIQCSGNDAPAAAASPCIHVFPKPYSPTIYRRRSNPGREGLEGRAAGNRLCNGAGQLGRASNLSPRAAALGRVLLLGVVGSGRRGRACFHLSVLLTLLSSRSGGPLASSCMGSSTARQILAVVRRDRHSQLVFKPTISTIVPLTQAKLLAGKRLPQQAQVLNASVGYRRSPRS